MMLNVLIAVVSDSYECAQIRSRVLFRRARLELAAEFEAIAPLFSWFNAGTYRVLEEEGARFTTRYGTPAQLLEWLKAQVRMVGADGAAHAADAADANADADADGGGGGDDEWRGRALDSERRVQRLLAASEARITAYIDQAFAEHGRRGRASEVGEAAAAGLRGRLGWRRRARVRGERNDRVVS